MKTLNLIRLSNKEIKKMAENIEWNERELAFIKPAESYHSFCKKNRHIVNTISSYKAFDDECELWRNIAMGMILEDRVEFNAN
jgi:hypothetical protein